MFGAPAGNLTAWSAWLKAAHKHIDPLPANVAILQWYRFPANGTSPGHVTVQVPGKGIYSAPYRSGTTHAVLPSISEVERIYGCKYVGWSEDINGVRVAKEESVDKITKEQENLCAIMKTGSLPGVNYNYLFAGKLCNQQNVDAMLQFWNSQPGPTTQCTPDERAYLDALKKIT